MAVRPGSSELLARLDRFLTDAQLTARSDTIHLDDLPEIKQRRVTTLLAQLVGKDLKHQ